MPIDFVKIKQRKVVQWALGYGAFALGLLQLLQFLSATYDWAPAILRAAPLLIVTGLLLTVVLAWFHGEGGAQRVTAGELSLLALILVVGSAGAYSLSTAPARRSGPPLVVMMDSPNPARVYDAETARANGTNADVISDILADLPIRRQKESVGPGWHRDEEIHQFDPDLVLVHFSAFCLETCTGPPNPRERLRQFIEYFAEDSPTEFLIYSRGVQPWSRTCGATRSCERLLRLAVDSVFAPSYAQHPGLRQRIHVFGISDYGEPHWHDPSVGPALKLRVKKLLGITA